jgi:hypothetical protein
MTKLPGILRWIVVFVAINACVEPAVFDTAPPEDLVVVDGMINDGPGPYRVSIFRARPLDRDTSVHFPVRGAVVTLHDDTGGTEKMMEEKAGEYWSSGVIRGRVDRSYHISINMPDGNVIVSVPEKILPGGEIEDVRYQFEARVELKPFGEVQSDVFNFFIDSHASTEATESTYIRWRLTGTYKVITHPELHTTFLQVSAYRTPYPCSGYSVEPALGGGKLVQNGPCVCCTCWIRHYETVPQLSDAEIVADGQFRNVKVGEVPISNFTFADKFLVEIEQMPISKTTYDFFNVIKIQKESSTNLFQAPLGRLSGNVKATDTSYPVVGLFWATSVTKKELFLGREDVPYPITPMEIIAEPCHIYFANSTLRKPANWYE